MGGTGCGDDPDDEKYRRTESEDYCALGCDHCRQADSGDSPLIRAYIWGAFLLVLLSGAFWTGQHLERQGWQEKALKAAESLKVIESQKDTRAHEIGVRSAAKQAAEVVYVDRLVKEIVAMPVDDDCSRLPLEFTRLYNAAASGADQMPAAPVGPGVHARADRE